MALEIFQAEIEGLVEGAAQLVHGLQVAVARCTLAMFQPLDAVAADALAHRQALATADPGRVEGAGAGTLAALFGQFVGQSGRQDVVQP